MILVDAGLLCTQQVMGGVIDSDTLHIIGVPKNFHW